MSSSSRPIKVKDLCNPSSDEERSLFSTTSRSENRNASERKARRINNREERNMIHSKKSNISQLTQKSSISHIKKNINQSLQMQSSNSSAISSFDPSWTKKTQSEESKFSIRKEKDYLCEKCGRLFKRKGDVEKHIRVVHEKIKDFICSICSRPFGRKDYLIKHQLSIHGISSSSAGKMK